MAGSGSRWCTRRPTTALRSASGDALDVRLSFAAGNRSLRVGADFVDAAGRQVAAVRVVHAAVNQATGTAVPLPDALRALAG